MQLDVCPPGDSPRDVVEAAVKQTTRWAKRSLATKRKQNQALFGIVQGACFSDLQNRTRKSSPRRARRNGFDGLALGGFSVGEPKEKMFARSMKREHARRGTPAIFDGRGHAGRSDRVHRVRVDMFDCVLPTRNARNGQALTRNGKSSSRTRNTRKTNRRSIPSALASAARADIHARTCDIFISHRKFWCLRLLSLHNLHFFGELMRVRARRSRRDLRGVCESVTRTHDRWRP